MCSIHILLLYLLEISFHIIVYSSITGVVTWTFYMQFTVLCNMELGPFLQAHNRWNLVFSFYIYLFKTSGIVEISLDINVSQHTLSICVGEINPLEFRNCFTFFAFFSKLWKMEWDTLLHWPIRLMLTLLIEYTKFDAVLQFFCADFYEKSFLYRRPIFHFLQS